MLQYWAEKHQQESAVAYHLHKVYVNDAMLGPYSAKRMEAVMCHYEAVLRKAAQGRRWFLKDFYKSKHIGAHFKDLRVTARVPDGKELVRTVKDFSDGIELHELLDEGFIVVSSDPNEVGVEYLSPYTTGDGDLVVAAVQCKFVSDEADWAEMDKNMETARQDLERMGINSFPVVYTTADKAWVQQRTYAKGVCFIASDIFDFTAPKLGILRLHVGKLGSRMKELYPWLHGAASESDESA